MTAGAPAPQQTVTAPQGQWVPVVVIGGGQAGLAAACCLRRAEVAFVVLDAADVPGGAWQYRGDLLHLFSLAGFSFLPGRPMPAQAGQAYPDAGRVVSCLAQYEQY